MNLIRRKGSSDDEWKKKLTPGQYKILRQKGTEPPFTGTLLHNKEKGVYQCAACGHELFSSEAKFDSGSGWPSFDAPLGKDSVETSSDASIGMRRVEVRCPNCGGHLGHVFDDGPTDTGKRYCINSVALAFKKTEGK